MDTNHPQAVNPVPIRQNQALGCIVCNNPRLGAGSDSHNGEWAWGWGLSREPGRQSRRSGHLAAGFQGHIQPLEEILEMGLGEGIIDPARHPLQPGLNFLQLRS